MVFLFKTDSHALNLKILYLNSHQQPFFSPKINLSKIINYLTDKLTQNCSLALQQ